MIDDSSVGEILKSTAKARGLEWQAAMPNRTDGVRGWLLGPVSRSSKRMAAVVVTAEDLAGVEDTDALLELLAARPKVAEEELATEAMH